tara:strand:+ start:1485 stop:1790 length:306 start_codon:yes stop_codon:yes gene_type:complete
MDEVESLLCVIENKYKKHNEFHNYLEDDILAVRSYPNFYNLKRIGYHLIHVFNDIKFSKTIFELALNKTNTDEELVDVISDITFLDEQWAYELQIIHKVKI